MLRGYWYQNTATAHGSLRVANVIKLRKNARSTSQINNSVRKYVSKEERDKTGPSVKSKTKSTTNNPSVSQESSESVKQRRTSTGKQKDSFSTRSDRNNRAGSNRSFNSSTTKIAPKKYLMTEEDMRRKAIYEQSLTETPLNPQKIRDNFSAAVPVIGDTTYAFNQLENLLSVGIIPEKDEYEAVMGINSHMARTLLKEAKSQNIKVDASVYCNILAHCITNKRNGASHDVLESMKKNNVTLNNTCNTPLILCIMNSKTPVETALTIFLFFKEANIALASELYDLLAKQFSDNYSGVKRYKVSETVEEAIKQGVSVSKDTCQLVANVTSEMIRNNHMISIHSFHKSILLSARNGSTFQENPLRILMKEYSGSSPLVDDLSVVSLWEHLESTTEPLIGTFGDRILGIFHSEKNYESALRVQAYRMKNGSRTYSMENKIMGLLRNANEHDGRLFVYSLESLMIKPEPNLDVVIEVALKAVKVGIDHSLLTKICDDILEKLSREGDGKNVNQQSMLKKSYSLKFINLMQQNGVDISDKAFMLKINYADSYDDFVACLGDITGRGPDVLNTALDGCLKYNEKMPESLVWDLYESLKDLLPLNCLDTDRSVMLLRCSPSIESALTLCHDIKQNRVSLNHEFLETFRDYVVHRFFPDDEDFSETFNGLDYIATLDDPIGITKHFFSKIYPTCRTKVLDLGKVVPDTVSFHRVRYMVRSSEGTIEEVKPSEPEEEKIEDDSDTDSKFGSYYSRRTTIDTLRGF